MEIIPRHCPYLFDSIKSKTLGLDFSREDELRTENTENNETTIKILNEKVKKRTLLNLIKKKRRLKSL